MKNLKGGFILASKKYYAVKVGRKTGIFSSWQECKKQVEGFSSAIYKGFSTVKEAENYLKNDNSIKRVNVKIEIESENHIKTKTIIAYVDGSYSEKLKKYSFGCILLGDKKTILSGVGNNEESATMRNVAGELLGAMEAIKWANENKYERIIIYHDYEGIARWATGDWKANQVGTKKYIDFIKNYKKLIDIQFQKVAAHSGDTYNDEADNIAKKALENSVTEEKMATKFANDDKKLKIFNKIMLSKDKAKNTFNIKFKNYYISESKLKKFVKELWKLEGKDIDQINVITMHVDTELHKIKWEVKDKTEELHKFDFLLF
ncbi:MAG: ribonuclease H family protein [Halanaerobiales bacterium]|nr:ribonuclease H family protein [Halanaerobiales bacterium]